MPVPVIYSWKKAPILKPLLSLVAGIIIHWYGSPPQSVWWLLFTVSLPCGILLFYLRLSDRFRLGWVHGFFLLAGFTAVGGLLAFHHDIRNTKEWIGNKPEISCVVATITSPLVEKNRSFKAEANITAVLNEDQFLPVKGKVIIYFKKDSLPPPYDYGTQIIFKKPLQEIRNTGNPGGFDYKRYCLFQGITHQVYLEPGDLGSFPGAAKKWLPSFLESSRQKILYILRTNIKGDRETGLAEALLIGYKDDLDKTLVQSYTNTGVVHIIAISGLHLGLIYALLVLLLAPLQRNKKLLWARPLVIIAGLWLFSLLAGAQPSILRSAVMFSCIVLGESLSRKTSIFNTLAFSALILLCYNPYWLWDVGFQLSYSAVLSIVIFMRPVYNLFYVKNKLLDLFWKLNAVTIAAQILTLPLTIYHFHQFPLYFLLTNFVAVPLSSLILIAEIILCAVSFIPFLAVWIGKGISALIWLMNIYVERIESLPFSVWDGLQINISQAILLFLSVVFISYWLLQKKKVGLQLGLAAFLCFAGLRAVLFWQAGDQHKIVVYNVPRHQAIDILDGRHFFFTGDTALVHDDFARNFYLKPSRTLNRVGDKSRPTDLFVEAGFASIGKKNILLIDHTVVFVRTPIKQKVDLLIISGNPKLFINTLYQSFSIGQIVFDGSVSPGKLKYWKKDCDSLRIPYHDVSEKGAFAMNLN